MNHRTPISELRLQGGTNLARALKRGPERALAKRADLEAMFADIMERRAEALADVKARGLLVYQDHFVRDKLYQKRVVNPSVKLAQACERQLVALAKALAAGPAADEQSEEKTGFFGEMLKESFDEFVKGDAN